MDKLLSEKKEVIAIDNLSTGFTQNLEKAWSNPLFTFYENDCTDVNLLKEVVKNGDIIIHLAGSVGVEKVCEDALETADNNYRSTRNLLEIARRRNCKIFFFQHL